MPENYTINVSTISLLNMLDDQKRVCDDYLSRLGEHSAAYEVQKHMYDGMVAMANRMLHRWEHVEFSKSSKTHQIFTY